MSFKNLSTLDHMYRVEDSYQKQGFIINIYVQIPVKGTSPKLE